MPAARLRPTSPTPSPTPVSPQHLVTSHTGLTHMGGQLGPSLTAYNIPHPSHPSISPPHSVSKRREGQIASPLTSQRSLPRIRRASGRVDHEPNGLGRLLERRQEARSAQRRLLGRRLAFAACHCVDERSQRQRACACARTETTTLCVAVGSLCVCTELDILGTFSS